MTTIYEDIRRDHDRHRQLLADLDKTRGGSGERESLFRRLKQEVEAHAAAEEQTFYATLIAQPDGQPKARHSVHEHKTAADLLEELDELDFGSGGWLKKFRKLKDELEHHMKEEEKEVFERARRLIADSTAEKLSGTFRSRKRAELD